VSVEWGKTKVLGDRQTDRPPPVPLGPQIHRAVSSVVKSWRLWEKCELFILQMSGESVKGLFMWISSADIREISDSCLAACLVTEHRRNILAVTQPQFLAHTLRTVSVGFLFLLIAGRLIKA
jgi:hypothetical protein